MNDENKKNSQKSDNSQDINGQEIDSADDVVYEASPDLEAGDDAVEDVADAVAKIKSLKAKLAECQKENRENLAGWQRAKADLINANRRHYEERIRFGAIAEMNVIEEFLPILDSFDMAMANKEAWNKIDTTWRIGVEHIRTQMLSVISKYGVEAIDPIGKKFDPNEHHSVEIVPTENLDEDDVIVQVVQKGYKKGDNIIRPATVKVANKK